MPASSKEFLDIQATIECGFTLKRVCDMTRTYSHHCYILVEIFGKLLNQPWAEIYKKETFSFGTQKHNIEKDFLI